jgi:hypothetical protein
VFVNTNAWRNCDWPRAVAGHPWRGPHHSGHFPVQSARSRRDLRQLFRRGRISLAIGLAFLRLVNWGRTRLVLSGEPLGGDSARELGHRGLGGDVAASRSVSL